MKCLACDCILKPHEDARKYKDSDERVQLCDKDLDGLDISTTTEPWEIDNVVPTEGSDEYEPVWEDETLDLSYYREDE